MKNFYYTKEHEWVSWEDKEAVMVHIGITDYAIELFGAITFIDLPEAGARIAIHDVCAVVESAKVASDIYSPLSGTIVSVNDALVDNPELINEDPMNRGWLIQLAVSDSTEIDTLMSQNAYDAYKST